MVDGTACWLTYAEAAALLGIDAGSAKRRAQRAGWPRQAGNDGRARVAVPAEALEGLVAGDVAPVRPPASPYALLHEALAENRRLAEANAALRERVAAAEAVVRALKRELNRWLRRAPPKRPGTVVARVRAIGRRSLAQTREGPEA